MLAKSFSPLFQKALKCLAHSEQTSAYRNGKAGRDRERVGGGDRKQQSMLVTKIAKINWSHPCGLAFASTNCTWALLQGIRLAFLFHKFKSTLE